MLFFQVVKNVINVQTTHAMICNIQIYLNLQSVIIRPTWKVAVTYSDNPTCIEISRLCNLYAKLLLSEANHRNVSSAISRDTCNTSTTELFTRIRRWSWKIGEKVKKSIFSGKVGKLWPSFSYPYLCQHV